jgi:serine/threonine-protein kinase
MAELEHPEGGITPSSIGPYRLARQLGRGGMGEVFLAWDERLGRRVAVKRILRDTPRPQDRERLLREARAAARLSHPAVVQVYDLVEDPAGDAIVMEYVEGRTLRALLTEGLPPVGVAVRMAREIVEGLAAAHAAGLVHRDLKAENVVVTPDGHAKILDFGIAKVPEGEGLTGQGVVVGTAHAMSPEQARGSEVDARSDLFSLGILLYELLTGASPFRGSNSLDELQRVISHSPTPVSRLRPEIPPALSRLVDRLLSKRREDRPRNAGEVARELASVSTLPELEAGGPDLPAETGSTVSEIPPGFLSPGAIRMSAATLRSRRIPILLIAALLIALVLSFIWLLRREAPEPLQVAVLASEGKPGGGSGLVESVMQDATLSTLASLEGMASLDPKQVAFADSPVQAARISAADEVIAIDLEREGPGARVSLRRVARDGRVLWTASFPVPAGSADRDLRLLADAVAVQLRRAYPDRRLRPGVPELAVSDRDYAELLRIKARIQRGSTDVESEMRKVEAVVSGSPRFLEGHLVLADLAQNLFTSNHKPAVLDRGLQAARAAAELAPEDPRPIAARFRLVLAAGRHEEAEAALKNLSEAVPGDPQLHSLAGQLAASRGDLDRAIAELTTATQIAPSWPNLSLLITYEDQDGRTAAARRHVEDLLALNPHNNWGLAQLAQLELQGGDPERAERIYLDIVHTEPRASHFTNIGLARSLLGRHAEAADAHRLALGSDPGNPYRLLNLSDAELALGNDGEARRLYSLVLQSLGRYELAAPLSPVQSMIRAQALAHLGHVRDAIKVTQKALRESGEDPEILYAASLVYAVAGDRSSALVNAELALKKGYQPRWFTLPAFGPLRDDPELKSLLRGVTPLTTISAAPAAR